MSKLAMDQLNKDIKIHFEAILSNFWMSDLANAAGFFFNELADVNWVGFYLYSKEKDQLLLGPFCGKVACTSISLNRGVCGKAARERIDLIVPNVHLFEGHITCDTNSQSEMVIPLIVNDQLIGVCDFDSPSLNRFTESDLKYAKYCIQQLLIANHQYFLKWPSYFP